MQNQNEIDQRRHLDKLRTSAWINQMNAVWRLSSITSYLEGAIVTGWFLLLFQYKQYDDGRVFSTVLLFVGSCLLYLIIFSIYRQVQILKSLAVELDKSEVLTEKNPVLKPLFIFRGRYWGADYAWIIPIFLIIVNSGLAIYTMSWLNCSWIVALITSLNVMLLLALLFTFCDDLFGDGKNI